MSYLSSTKQRLPRAWWLKFALLALPWLLTACVMPDGSVVTSWSQLTSPREKTVSSTAVEAAPLRVVTIEPIEIASAPEDLQIVQYLASTSYCGDGRIWQSRDFLFYGGAGPDPALISTDGQTWQGHFEGRSAVVACAPNGSPHAIVFETTPEKVPFTEISAILYRMEDEQWIQVSAIPDEWAPLMYGLMEMAVDTNGGVWVTSYVQESPGIFHFDGASWQAYVSNKEQWLAEANDILKTIVQEPSAITLTEVHEVGILGTRISDIEVGPDGLVWLGNVAGSVRFDGETWNQVVTKELQERIGSEAAIVTAVDAEGEPWLMTDNGALHQEDGAWTLYQTEPPLPLWPLSVDHDGTVWFWSMGEIGDVSFPLLRYDGANWQLYAEGMLLIYPTSRSLDAVVASDGSLWFLGMRFLPGGPAIPHPSFP